MADAVIGTDLEYRVTLWNPAAERLYGCSAEEAIGRPARELATFEGDTARLRLEAALDRDGIAHVEFRARTQAGVWRDVEVIATAVRDASGERVGYLGIHRDVSARRRADREHQRLSARADTVFSSITDAFYALDRDFRFIYLNDRAVQVLGDLLGEDLEREDFLGQEVFSMFPGVVATATNTSGSRSPKDARSPTSSCIRPARAGSTSGCTRPTTGWPSTSSTSAPARPPKPCAGARRASRRPLRNSGSGPRAGPTPVC
jgi:PAS domain S-box-containing protein